MSQSSTRPTGSLRAEFEHPGLRQVRRALFYRRSMLRFGVGGLAGGSFFGLTNMALASSGAASGKPPPVPKPPTSRGITPAITTFGQRS